MNRRAGIFVFGLFCTLYSIILNAGVCSNLIKSIAHDINHSGEAINTIRLPWMNIYWLKNQLGSPTISKPDKSSASLQYSWHCPENSELNLIAMANSKGLITEINGQYSSEEGAEFFSTALPQNSVQTPEATIVTKTETTKISSPTEIKIIIPPVEQQKPIIQTDIKKTAAEARTPPVNPFAELLNPYNANFQLSLKTKDELTVDMTNKIKNFYKNMRSCNPGIYRYAVYLQSGFIFPVSTIEGKKNGSCKVNTLFTVEKLGDVNAKCIYKIKTLAVYTDQEAEMLIKGKSFDKTKPTLRDKAEASACQTYINGKLQPKLAI